MDGFEEFYKLPSLSSDYKKNIILKRPKVLAIMDQMGKPTNNMKYFNMPKKYPLDLNEGYEKYKFRTELHYNKHLEHIEKYMMSMAEDNNNPDIVNNIYTRRGILVTLMETPYSPDWYEGGWTILATKFENAIHLIEDNYEAKGRKNSPSDTYAFKLRQYCFADYPNAMPNTEEPIDESKQTYIVTETTLGNFNILYVGEIQGVKSDKKIDVCNIEELNKCNFTITKILMQKRNWLKEFKLLVSWIQATLSNATDIYIAFKERHDPGIIKKPIQHLSPMQIIESNSWKPYVCVGFLYKFLTLVETKMENVNSPHTVYEFRYCNKTKKISYKIHEGKTDKSFLSNDYIEFVKNKHL